MQTNLFTKYSDGTPISYQLWNNYLIKNQNLNITESYRKSLLGKVEVAQRTIYPQLQNGDSCVVMLSAVLTEPDWVTIPCNEKFLQLVLCQKVRKNTHWEQPTDNTISHRLEQKTKECKQGQLFINNNCILFLYFNKNTNITYQYLHVQKTKFLDQNHFHNNTYKFMPDYLSLIQYFFLQPLQFTNFFPCTKYIPYI